AGQAVLVLARVRRAARANARAGGELFAIETLATSAPIAGATSTAGPLARRWARSRLDELLAGAPNAAAVTALALEFGLVSPYTSMVAIGEEVVIKGGTKRSIAVPVSVPAGMKWQAVKQETSLGVAAAKGDVNREVREPLANEHRPRTSDAVPRQVRPPTAADRAEPDEDEASDVDLPRPAPARDVAATGTATSDGEVLTEAIAMRAGLLGRQTRLSASLGGGVVRADGTSGGLLALGARLELGGRTLAGIDGALWLADGDLQGRVLLSLSRLGLSRWLELGAGAGVHVGAGIGPGGSLSLRYHVPPAPRAAAVLRYDGAVLFEHGERRGQHGLTLGVEWGF
ncbi:MAG: hypothetical protein M3680_30160, partial [Myxococcota bacterium]|nr:hypothetical protein [Myxococcota bacterium]